MRLRSRQNSFPQSHYLEDINSEDEPVDQAVSAGQLGPPNAARPIWISLFNIFSLPIHGPPECALSTAQAIDAASTEDLVHLRRILLRKHPRALEIIRATGEATDDVFLSKWLRARGPPPDVAAALASHAAWRETFVGLNSRGIAEESIADALMEQKVCLQGVDPKGRPLLVFLASHHRHDHSADRTARLMTYALDAACSVSDPQRNPERVLCCIFDMNGVSALGLDVGTLRVIFDLLQTHFPNVLSHLYFVDAPLLFYGVWRCVMPFINEHTRSKISFVSGHHGRRQLLSDIGPDVLPVNLGGSAELLSVDEAMKRVRSGGFVPCSAPTMGPALGQKDRRFLAGAADGMRAFKSSLAKTIGRMAQLHEDRMYAVLLLHVVLMGLAMRVMQATVPYVPGLRTVSNATN